MKIACITTSIIPSKSANSIQAMKVVHALQELNQDVRLWVPDFARAEWPEIAALYGLSERLDMKWIPFQPLAKQYDFCWRAVREAVHWKADVVYTWSLQAAAFASLQGVPVSMEFHDFPMGSFGPKLFKFLVHYRGKKLFLTTTRALAEGIEQRFGFRFDPQALQIAPNGTEPQRYEHLPSPQAARAKLGLQNGFTVGYSGHFYAGRGMDLLLEITRNLPEIHFLWVGGQESDVKPWRKQLEEMGIKNATITGFIPNSQLPTYQAAAEILVMPYSKKIAGSSGGSIERVINPMKMFDYMAAGRAIVASDIPVFHEVLNENIAVFCQPENPQDWADVIKNLKNNPKQLKALGTAAKKEAEKYTWKKRAQETLYRLEKILQ